MKRKHFILLFLAGCMFMSCEHTMIPNKEGTGNSGDSEPWMQMKLVKFTDDKYREYILAEHLGDDSPVRMRGTTPPVVEELIVGTIPYSVKLPNEYWLVDWRWGDTFIYHTTNVLLPYKWETLTHWNQIWNMPENPLSFNEYIEDVGSIPRRVIDTYLGINLDVSRWSAYGNMLYNRHLSGRGFISDKNIPAEEREPYYECVHQQDSLHDIYTQRLIKIINNGDFEKVYNKRP